MPEPRDRISPSFSFGRPRRRPAPQPAPSAPVAPSGSAAAGDPTAGDLRRWAAGPKATLAIVFTDMVGSALLTNKLGNRAMGALRRAHFEQAGRLVAAHGGFLVKTLGDSVLAVFRAAGDALDFALALRADPGDGRVRLRAGVHVGPVNIEAGDAYGAAVNYAARVVAAPREAEVWLSSEARDHVEQDGAAQHARLRWRAHEGLVLKGFPGRHVLWSVVGPEGAGGGKR